MEADGVIKLLLTFELLKGNQTIRDPYQIDRVTNKIMARIGWMPTTDPAFNIVEIIASELQTEGIQL